MAFCATCGANVEGRFCANCGSPSPQQAEGAQSGATAVALGQGGARPESSQERPRGGKTKKVATIAAAAVIVAALAIVVPMLLSGAKDAIGPKKVTITGALTMRCYKTSERGYDDIRQGAEVSVKDEKGTVIGTGVLGKRQTTNADPAEDYGDLTNEAYFDLDCEFPISVPDVPSDRAFYSLEVARRGEIRSSRQELEANGWKFDISLGR